MARKYGTTWAHLHIGRVRRGLDDVVSVKTGDAPVEYVAALLLRDVVFNVREAGRQATVQSGVKNVHAWVTGEKVNGHPVLLGPEGWTEVKYNPRNAIGAFYTAPDGEPIYAARYAYLVGTKVYVRL